MTLKQKQPRIGVYAGTFDPVHAGHVSFALHAREMAHLDEVYFLPERMPRHKSQAEHYGHRVGMLRRAVRPYNTLSVLELVDKHFTVQRTMLALRQTFPDTQLVLLMGADVFVNVPEWSAVHRLLLDVEFVVSIRGPQELPVVLQTMQRLKLPTPSVTIVDSMRPDISSTQVRLALAMNQTISGLLPSVQRYARQEWLYVKVPRSARV